MPFDGSSDPCESNEVSLNEKNYLSVWQDESSESCAKFKIGTRVTVRCDFNPNYFLHGKVINFDVDSRLYTAEFDEKDDADPQKNTANELQKIVTKPVVRMKGILLVPYAGMTVFAFRGDDEVEAEIVQAYHKNAKLKWADDNSLSILCLPYNQIRPINDNDKVEKKQADEDKFPLMKSNVGSYFASYVGFAVIMAYPEVKHRTKIIAHYDNVDNVQYTADRTVNQVPYARYIPVLDIEIPCAKRRKCN